MKKRNSALGGILAILGLLFAVNVLATLGLRGARLDLTEGKLYSLSPGTHQILAAIDEPIHLDFYYSSAAAEGLPQYRNYAERVREFLEEMVAESHGKLLLQVLNPEPFSEAEDAAAAAGLSSLPVDGVGTKLYFGLVGRNAVDDTETIGFFDPSRESFLEYDLTKLVYSLTEHEKPTIGLLTSLKVDASFDPQNPGRPTRAWQFLTQMRQLYTVETIQPTDAEIPDDVDVLLLVHPKGLGDDMLHAIDDFAVDGGRILAFVDPFCEADPAASGGMYGQPQGGSPTSDLGPLLKAWGVDWNPAKVVGDRTYAQRVRAPGHRGLGVVDYVAWLGLRKAAFAADDPTCSGLSQINLASAGAFQRVEGSELKWEPLLQSSADSMLLDSSQLRFMPDPARLLASFTPDDKTYDLAVRISGQVDRAFPKGDEDEAAEKDDRAAPARIILVGDADMLRDDLWIVEQRLGPVSLGWQMIADNGNLLLNALELLGGNDALVSLRGRGSFERPFEKVEALRQRAEARYLQREQELQDQIDQGQQRIAQLQRDKPGSSKLILSPEQEKEIQKLEQQMLDARKELRQVRHGLSEDIDALGTRLLVLNAAIWPLLVALGVLLWHLRRHRGRRHA